MLFVDNMQNGAAPMSPSYKPGYAMSGAYAVVLAPRDRVDYSVTKGGLKLWAVLFVFIVLCSSLYTVISQKDLLDVAFDLDGDGEIDNDVDDGDDDEALHAERRQEKEKELSETPSRSPGEKLSSPDRHQSKRNQEEDSEENSEDGKEVGEVADDTEENQDNEEIEAEPPKYEEKEEYDDDDDGDDDVENNDDADEEENLEEIERRMLESLKQKAKARAQKEKKPRKVKPEKVEEEKELENNEEVEEPKIEEPEQIKIKVKRTKGAPPKHPVKKEYLFVEMEEEEQEEEKEEDASEEQEKDASAQLEEPAKIKVIRKKGPPKSAPKKQPKAQAEDEEKEEMIEEEAEPAEEKGKEESKISVKVYRTKGTQTKNVNTVSKRPQAKVADEDEDGDEEETCEIGGSCNEDDESSENKKIRVFRTKGPPKEVKQSASNDVEEDGEDDQDNEVEETLETKKSAIKTTRSSYKKRAITNKEDNKIRTLLDDVEKLLEETHLEDGLLAINSILLKHPKSPRGHYIKARALDLSSEKKQSNQLLEQSIREYDEVLSLPAVPDALFQLAGNRLVERCKFRGWMQKALVAQKRLVERFPDDLDVRNDYGLAFLMIGRNDDAKNVFQSVLQIDPTDGFAKVHLGFILKTVDENYEEAIKYLSEGIKSNATGTRDGRFYFQLGDALQRLGRNQEAYEIYDIGVSEGLFLSRYQRSLYNVETLTARPWWSPEQTTYQAYLKAIEKEWKIVKKEGLSLLNQHGLFSAEDEKLTNKGDWKQFTLFQRGRKIVKNCAKAPKTCAIMENFPAATGCTRGQIKFSVLHAGTRVWPHCGPTNCRLRAHLGLVVPPEPRIRVGTVTKAWKEGKFIIFDDSYEHEVWHNGDSLRLVLIVDFWHPQLSAQQKASLAPI